MDNCYRMQRRIERVEELSSMTNLEEVCLSVANGYRFYAEKFAEGLRFRLREGKLVYRNKKGYKENLREFLEYMEGLLKVAEAMQDDAKAVYDYAETVIYKPETENKD